MYRMKWLLLVICLLVIGVGFGGRLASCSPLRYLAQEVQDFYKIGRGLGRMCGWPIWTSIFKGLCNYMIGVVFIV